MDNYVDIILNADEKIEAIFYKATDFAVAKEIEEGYDKLDENEKYLYMVGKIIMEVNNGGFDQYFFNTDGVYAEDTLQFLNLLGEKKFSKLVDKALKIYNSSKSDDDKEEAFENLDDKFYELGFKEYEELYNKCIYFIRERIQ